MGDYVWFDKNRDGLQDEDEDGIEGVILKLVGPDGKEVTDVYGNPVGPTKTDKDGYYVFENLPPLADGEHYTVLIDQEESKDALSGFVPTKETEGNREKDSSTWEAESESLTNDGDHDGTLDFGFVLAEEEPEPQPSEPEPTDPEPSEPQPTDPEPTESEDPSESPEPSESDDPESSQTPESSKSEEPTKAPEKKDDEELVNTGFTALSILVLGSILAAAGVLITRRSRRRHG